MGFDLLIKGGTVVDGSGAPSYQADVAVSGGKIVEIGRKLANGGAKRSIDADGMVVSPGFIDPHTHYDAQICWDPEVTPSSWHGITTVVMGNCGVGIAPCKPQTREVAAWDLVNVEAIPLDALKKGITWDWVSFPEYMDAAARRGSALNLGFLAPLTPFRHYVMGEASMERAATEDETAQVASLFRQAYDAGAFGFTTTLLKQHIGYQGRPLASRLASRQELAAYSHVLRERGSGVIEVALTQSPGAITAEECDSLDFLLTESGAKVTWLALLNRDDAPEACQDSLRLADPLIRRGGVPQVTCRPLTVQVNLRSPFIFGDWACWKPIFNQSVETQKELYGSAQFRDAVRQESRNPRIFSARWERLEIAEVGKPALKALEGRTVGEIAAERGKDLLDTFLDLAIEDDLAMVFSCALFNANEARIPELLKDPRTMLGLSDGGAHVDMLCDAGYATHFLGRWVRDAKIMSLERGVQRLTSEPARFFGIEKRGRLAPGMAADINVFDLDKIGCAPRNSKRNDLPGGGRRLVVESFGIRQTIVNGQVVRDNGSFTGSMAGQVIRAGSA
ncbi:MAG: amidohydrolase family protein [Nevskia sp.]|nr:amidohydrolase family protein [Nevskia sp.]